MKAIQVFTKTSSHSALIMQIQRLLMNIESRLLQFVIRDNNKDVDYIVKMIFKRKDRLNILESYKFIYL